MGAGLGLAVIAPGVYEFVASTHPPCLVHLELCAVEAEPPIHLQENHSDIATSS